MRVHGQARHERGTYGIYRLRSINPRKEWRRTSLCTSNTGESARACQRKMATRPRHPHASRARALLFAARALLFPFSLSDFPVSPMSVGMQLCGWKVERPNPIKVLPTTGQPGRFTARGLEEVFRGVRAAFGIENLSSRVWCDDVMMFWRPVLYSFGSFGLSAWLGLAGAAACLLQPALVVRPGERGRRS